MVLRCCCLDDEAPGPVMLRCCCLDDEAPEPVASSLACSTVIVWMNVPFGRTGQAMRTSRDMYSSRHNMCGITVMKMSTTTRIAGVGPWAKKWR